MRKSIVTYPRKCYNNSKYLERSENYGRRNKSSAENTTVESQPAKENLNGTVKVMSALAYLWILFFLPLVVCPDSKFGRYHANQGLVLLLAAVVANVIGAVLSLIPAVGWILQLILNVAMLVLTILGIVNVCNGETKPLPIIGGLTLIK